MLKEWRKKLSRHWNYDCSDEEKAAQTKAAAEAKKPSWWGPKVERAGYILRLVITVLFVLIFFMTPDIYRNITATGTHYGKKKILMVLILLLITVAGPEIRKRIRWNRSLKIVLLTLCVQWLPLLAVEVTERVHGRQIVDYPVDTLFYNYIIVMAMFVLCFGITNRIRGSLLAAFSAIVLFSVINRYVIEFRNEPILAGDLTALGTAANVASSYQIDMNYGSFIGGYAILFLWNFLYLIPVETRPRGFVRLGTAIVAICCSLGLLNNFAYGDYLKKQGVVVKMFDSVKSYEKSGQALIFLRGFNYTRVKKPEGYSVDAVKKQLAQYSSDLAVDEKKATETSPNMIIIMDEALADLGATGNLEVSEDCLEYIHSLKGQPNTIYGTLYTSVFGGHTANTEYELLTGNSTAYLPASAVPYTLFVKKEQPAMAWHMDALGYGGLIGFHPHKASGYSRDLVYPRLGFQKTIFKEDMKDDLTQDDLMRKLVSDQCDFETIVEEYEALRAESEDPFYMFNVTMQNHGGYELDHDNLIRSIKMEGNMADEADVERYINLVDRTDDAFKYLTEYFSQVDEPTMIILFGDHEPGLSSSFLTKLWGKSPSQLVDEEIFLKYQTPLVIWANYDINPDGKLDEKFDPISANYLSAMLMDLADLPMTGYQKYLLDLREKLPVITGVGCLDQAGNFYDPQTEKGTVGEWLKEYQSLIYNNQFDSKHRVHELFSLAGS